MPIIRSDFHTHLASELKDSIVYNRSNIYYYLGKLDTWQTEGVPPTEPDQTYANDVEIRDNMLYMRKVTANDVSLVCPSYKWTSGTVYDQWDHTIDMSQRAFYVITDEFDVYKCLNNNLGAPSTSKPTGTSLTVTTTSDGYVWKYMYNVPIVKRRKFVAENLIPVQKAISDSFYSKGAVEGVIINNGGSDYTSAPQTTITIAPPTGTGVTAEITCSIVGGVIDSVTIDEPGTNYLFSPRVTVPTSVANATAIIELSIDEFGSVDGYTIVDGGFGYITAPALIVEAPRVSAAASIFVNVDTGEIDSVAITNAGAGYSTPPVITVFGDGTGKYFGNLTAIVESYIFEGRLDRLSIVDPGIDYVGDSSTQINSLGDGTGALFYPSIQDGTITDVVVANPGINYTFINLQVTGITGSGADLTALIGTSDFTSDQLQVEQTSVPGAIYAIKLTEPGTGYTSTTEVTIEGDGTGATAHAVVVGGNVTAVVVDTYGSGYTRATVVFTDPNRFEPNLFTDAAAYAILPPTGGHGNDAVKELGGNTMCMFVLVRDDAALSALQQDYRQFGLIRNPVNVVNRQLARDTSYIVAFKCTLVSVDDIVPDNILINNARRYRVVDVDGTQVVLQQLNSIFTTPSGSFTREDDPNVTYTISSVDSSPTIDKYSGDLLYVTNNTPFVPTTTQAFGVRTYITL